MAMSFGDGKIIISAEGNNKYDETRKRVTRFYNNYNMSDREIIEKLAEEIEQYRNRIKNQNEIIDELSKREVKSEVVELNDIDEMINEDIIEIRTTTTYADGRPRQAITEYEYKNDEE